MIPTYLNLLRKLLDCPAETRVLVYMHLLLTPLAARNLKPAKCIRYMSAVRQTAREFLLCPTPPNEARVRDAIEELKTLEDSE